MNNEIVHYSQNHIKNYSIPLNLNEIVKSSLPRDFDLTTLVKHETTQKIINDEMNDFNFYNIPIGERIDPDKMNRTGFADFKSMHKLQAFNEKRGIHTTSRFFKKQKLSLYEQNIRKGLKANDQKLFLLREIYENFDSGKIENYQKRLPEKISKYNKTIETEVFDRQLIQDLENWEHNKSIPMQPKKDKESRNNTKHSKNVIQKKKTANKRANFPSLTNFKNRDSILVEDPIAKEKMLKFAKNEQFKDETLGKTLINYIKAYESPELIRNRIRERDQVQKAQETGDEKLGLSVADLSKQMKLMFLNIIEGPLIDRAKGYKQMSCSLMLKIMKKIKDSEAFLYSRSLTMITVRKENGKILEKLKSIKEIIISTKEKINKSKNRKSVKNSNDSFLDLALKNPIQKIDKKNNRTPNLLTAERNSIQNFMEKAIDEQMKEEEINKLNDNKLNFEMKLIYNEQILSQMEGENQVERKNLKETQKLIRNFLFKLLENGKDCRNNGLSWIILELWKLGEIVYLQSLPKFLDQKGKEFLLSKAKKEQELSEISTIFQTFLENFQGEYKRQEKPIEEIDNNPNQKKENNEDILEQNLKEKLFNKSYYQEPSIIDKNCADSLIRDSQTLTDILHSKKSVNDQIYADTKKKIRIEVSPARAPKSEDLTIKKEKKLQLTNTDAEKDKKIVNSNNQIIYIENDKKINEYKTKENFFKESEVLEKKIEEKQKQIFKLEKNEIIRIIKEFDYQEYGYKYSTDCECVLSALIGARKAYIELIRYGMLKR